MARKRFTVEQIISKLREAEVKLSQSLTVGQVCKKLEVTEQSYYRWRKEYGSLRMDQAKQLKELERENARLKKLVAERGFDDLEVIVREKYTWSKTDSSEPIVQKMVSAYQEHDIEPEIWPIATWTAPYFVFSRILRLPVVSGGLGHGGREHVANEYMTVRGLLDFEKFVATFLYQMAE